MHSLHSLLRGLVGTEWCDEFPAVVAHLPTLTRLNLAGNIVTVLPAGVAALASLSELALGHPPWGKPGHLDVQALGCLSAFPQLFELALFTATCGCAFVPILRALHTPQ